MELSDFDFSKCRYNPLSRGFVKRISDAIPEFRLYRESDIKKVFTYIVILYDKQSPLWAKEPEYFPRKVLAARLANLSEETKGGSFNSKTREALEGRSKMVNMLTTAYLANMGDIDYTMLINEMAMFYGYSQQMAGGTMLNPAEYKTMKELAENIAHRTRKIFGSGEDEELTRVKIALYEKTEKDRQKLNPEAIAKLIVDEGDFPPDWNPYGVKYKIDKLKYINDESEEG